MIKTYEVFQRTATSYDQAPRKTRAHEYLLSKKDSFEGAFALLVEDPAVTPVRLDEIELNDDGFRALSSAVPDTALTPGNCRIRRIESQWDQLSIGDWKWSGGENGWRLYFDEFLMQEVLAMAERLPPSCTDFYRYTTLTGHVRRREFEQFLSTFKVQRWH